MKMKAKWISLFLALTLLFSLCAPTVMAAGGELGDGKEAAAFLLENRQEDALPRTIVSYVNSNLPAQYDLRDLGVVTPVKLQNPFGTCWGFAAIAAAETSILSEMGKTYEETGLDLSEHHLAYFARQHLSDGSSQDGEGCYIITDTDPMNTGGFLFTASSLFSSGIGVVTEDLIPYQGTNGEIYNMMFYNISYSEDDDWTIPEEYQFVQTYALENSDVLLSPAVYEADINDGDFEEREAGYLGYDAAATEAMKQEIYAGRAISITFAADQSMPGAEASGITPNYINTANGEWAHYTYDGGIPNHAVTIVGWDDDYPATNFLDHSDDPYGDGTPHQPEGNGAWIVKNSWGAATESFPNNGVTGWGITDENGQSTGYFYLSYYDRSLSAPETFDFDITGNESGYIIDQYDYMPESDVTGFVSKAALQSANIFTAEYDAVIKAVSCQTNLENTDVLYQVYLLDDDTQIPDEGELVSETEGSYVRAGFHQIQLEQTVPVSAGQRYAVVVTQKVDNEDGVLFTFSGGRSENEAFVTEYNRTEHRKNHDTPDEELGLCDFYAKGIVNPGESFVYIDELGQWFDYADIVPELQKTEEFSPYDFDNISIKAYSDFPSEEAAATALAASDPLPELNYVRKTDVGNINMGWILKTVLPAVLGIILLLTLLIVLLVKKIRKRKKAKAERLRLEQALEQANARIAELEAKLGEAQPKNE